MTMILSLYNILFENNDKRYLLNSQTRLFSQIHPELYIKLLDGSFMDYPEEVLKTLKEKKILVPEEEKYNYYYSRQSMYLRGKYDPTHLGLVLVPTTACNLDCYYCFEPKKNPNTISDETIGKLVETIRNRKQLKSISITWYGGEPLLAFGQIKKIWEGLTHEGMPSINFQSIITNGVLLDEEKVRFFKEAGLNTMQITLDGNAKRHDSIRCFKSNRKPTFDLILENIDKATEIYPELVINIRVNIDRENWEDYVAISKMVSERYPGKKVNVYPGFLRIDNDTMTGLCHPSILPKEHIAFRKRCREHGVHAELFPVRTGHGCMLQADNSMIIGPEGEIYKCWNDVSDPDKVTGHISDERRGNRTLNFRYLHTCSPFNEECRECAVFPICDGGCGHQRYRNTYEGGRYDLCTPYKDPEVLKDALLSGDFDLNPAKKRGGVTINGNF